MNEPKPTASVPPTAGSTTPDPAITEPTYARGSGRIGEVTPDRPARTEHSVTEGLPDWKAERIAAMRRELADLQRQLIESQQRIATELQGRAEDAERYEALEARLHAQELELQQKGASAVELENEIASLRSKLATATATADKLSREAAESPRLRRELETRDAELATAKSERDALKVECEEGRRAVDAASAKARELATQVVRLGQDLLDGSGGARIDSEPNPPAVVPEPDGAGSGAEPKPIVVPPILTRAQPPALPRRSARVEATPVEAILDVTADAKPATSRVAWALWMVAGVILGCAATAVVMNRSDSNTTAAASAQDPVALPSPAIPSAPAATAPPAPTVDVETPPPTAVPQPAPVTADTAAGAEAMGAATERPPEPPESTTGILALPPEAAGHRVFVDGRSVEVKSFRVEVPCGTREVKIGSRGTAQTIDVACGGTTDVPATRTSGAKRGD